MARELIIAYCEQWRQVSGEVTRWIHKKRPEAAGISQELIESALCHLAWFSVYSENNAYLDVSYILSPTFRGESESSMAVFWPESPDDDRVRVRYTNLGLPMRLQVVLGQIAARVHHAKARPLIYKAGHPIKRRSQDTANAATAARDELECILDQATDEPEVSATLPIRQLTNVYQLIKFTISYAEATRSFAELLNMLAAVIEKGGPEGLLEKAGWHSYQPFSFSRILEDAFSNSVARSGYDEIKAVNCPDCRQLDLIVGPWLGNTARPFSPSSDIYAALLGELTSNAARHGNDVDGRVLVKTWADVPPAHQRDKCVTKMYFSHDVHPNTIVEDVGEAFQPQDAGQTGGLGLVAHLLSGLELGQLFKRCQQPSPANPSRTWEYRLELNGVRPND